MENIVDKLLQKKIYYGEPNRHGGFDDVSYTDPDCEEGAAEIQRLRLLLVKYGDRVRMARAEPAEMQQAIDRAFEFRPK